MIGDLETRISLAIEEKEDAIILNRLEYMLNKPGIKERITDLSHKLKQDCDDNVKQRLLNFLIDEMDVNKHGQ